FLSWYVVFMRTPSFGSVECDVSSPAATGVPRIANWQVRCSGPVLFRCSGNWWILTTKGAIVSRCDLVRMSPRRSTVSFLRGGEDVSVVWCCPLVYWVREN